MRRSHFTYLKVYIYVMLYDQVYLANIRSYLPFSLAGVPKSSKALMVLTLWSFIISLGINSSELYVYTNSPCDDEGSLAPWIGVDFTALIIVKLYWLTLINARLKGSFLKSSPLVPFGISGFFILLQFPQMTYDYDSCTQRNPIFSRIYAFNFAAALGVTVLSIFVWRVLQLTFYLCECELFACKFKKLRHIKLAFTILLILLTHSQAILLGLTQSNWWSANLFVEYTLYSITAILTLRFVCKHRETTKPTINLRISIN